jgi:ribonucleoside-diphosphate reductase alpha chain
MDLSGSSETGSEDVAATVVEALKKAAEPMDSKSIRPRLYPVETDRSRDALLTDFGKETLQDRYLLPGESYQDLFARVASAYADDAEHAQRVYDYISSSGSCRRRPFCRTAGTGRGLPISCYLNSVDDSLEGIVNTWNENVWLRSSGGGIGTYWGSVRGIGEPVGLNGKTSGIIPFVAVMDSLTLAISQGSLRRGSAAVYLDVSHPEIEEFLEIRKPSGDFNRKALNLHHGVLVTDAFMEAVRDGAEWTLRSPKDGSERATVDARSLFQKLVETRLATGEPYIIFIDQVNRSMPEASPRSRPQGLDLQPLLRDHAADRQGPSRQGPHRRLLPLVLEPRDLGPVERRQEFHRGRDALPRQCPDRLYRPRARGDGPRTI